MGQDKALLELDSGNSMLEYALALAASVSPKVALAAPRARYGQLRWAGEIIEDEVLGRGPMAGIVASLKHTTSELNLFIAVDMPLLTKDLLAFLLKRAEAIRAPALIPFANGLRQPLCAVYRRSFLPFAEQALAEGQNKIGVALERAGAVLLPEADLIVAGFSAEQFRNVNTPEEYERLRTGTLEKK